MTEDKKSKKRSEKQHNTANNTKKRVRQKEAEKKISAQINKTLTHDFNNGKNVSPLFMQQWLTVLNAFLQRTYHDHTALCYFYTEIYANGITAIVF